MTWFKKLFTTRMKIGLFGLSLVTGGAFLAPVLRAYDPLEMNLALSLQGPSLKHPFGLDENGADLLSQVLYGARTSLWVSGVVVLLSLLIGLLVGSVSAFLSTIWDQILMRFVDMVFAFPRFLLALAVLAMLGASVQNLILAMCLTGWAGFARLVRAEVLRLKTEDYIISALSYGAGIIRILIYHIWPNLIGLLMVQVAFSLVAVVVAEAGLSFLGLGVPPEVPSWGKLLSSGRQVLEEAPHLSVFPGLAIFTLVLSFQLCGDALRDFYDPQSVTGNS